MKIGDLAKKLGVSTKTIRYYETLGIIPKAQRAENGYRLFSASAVATAQLVSTLRKLKFSIDDIKALDINNNQGQLRQILERILDKKRSEIALDIAILQGQLDEKRVQLEVDEEARLWLVEKGYDRTMGARPMARVIQEHIKKPLADMVLFGTLNKGGTALVSIADDRSELKVSAVVESEEAVEA